MPTFGTLNGGHTAIASSPACAVAEISKQKMNSPIKRITIYLSFFHMLLNKGQDSFKQQ